MISSASADADAMDAMDELLAASWSLAVLQLKSRAHMTEALATFTLATHAVHCLRGIDARFAAEWAAGVAEILADPADLERKHAAGLDLSRAYDRFLRRHPRGAGA